MALPLVLSLFLTALAAAQSPPAPCVVVWLDSQPPAAELTRRTQARTQGACQHRAWGAIAGAPGAFGSDDEERLSGVRTALNVAAARWTEFDVEPELAGNLSAAVDAVTVIRNDGDRDLVREALFLAGAATFTYFPGERLAKSAEASPWRRSLEGQARIAPWLDAIGLGGPPPGRATVRETTAHRRFQEQSVELMRTAPGQLSMGPLPPSYTMFVDGTPQKGTSPLALLAGRHWIHFLSDGEIVGRTRVEVLPGVTLAIPLAVRQEDLVAARSALLAGGPAPQAVAAGVAAMAVAPGARVYLATLDDAGVPKVFAQSAGAMVAPNKTVNLVVSVGASAGLVRSAGFVGSPGTATNTVGLGPDLRLELGLSNFVLYGGTRLVQTPGQTVLYLPPSAPPDGVAEAADNRETNSLYAAYGGIGVFMPKPTPGRPIFMIGADAAVVTPGMLGFGGRFSAGIPVSDDGLWLRLGADVHGEQVRPGYQGAGTRTMLAGAEVGVARLF